RPPSGRAVSLSIVLCSVIWEFRLTLAHLHLRLLLRPGRLYLPHAKTDTTLHPPSKWQCGMNCASFAGPWGATRLTAISTATSASPTDLPATAAPLVSGCGYSSACPSWLTDIIGVATKPRGS